MFESKRQLDAHGICFAVLIGAALCVLVCAKANADDCFDGNRAFDHVRAMVEIGPRPPGSPGIEKARRYITNKLALSRIEVREERFVAATPLGPLEMENIIAVVPGKTRDIIIIGAHYDSKLFKDVEFVGANDGGSGTAVLLELARCLSTRENATSIWLVFFDGEEALVRWSTTDGTYGSRHMANRLFTNGDLAMVKAMILVDMVGDKDLGIEWETNSTPWLKTIIWENAAKLGYRAHFLERGRRISDDHVPFLSLGIPSVDIIDFNYGPNSRSNEYWHTPEDTIDKISPASLKIVGDVVLESIDPVADHGNRKVPGLSATE